MAFMKSDNMQDLLFYAGKQQFEMLICNQESGDDLHKKLFADGFATGVICALENPWMLELARQYKNAWNRENSEHKEKTQ